MGAHHASTAVYSEPRRHRKYFTVAEANQALTYVARVTDDISDRYRRAVEIRQRIDQSNGGEGLETVRDAYEDLVEQLNHFIDELTLVGVELKDFQRGLIDFPALHEGREVYLCWERGEDRVVAWHEVDAGFAGRKEVALLDEPAVEPPA